MTRKPISGEEIARRSGARLAAVQALYQMEVSGASTAEVLEDISAGRLPAGDDGALDDDVDLELFRQIIEAAVEKQAEIDTIIAQRLAKGWKLERIDSVARATLRAGVAELWRRKDVPAPVVINEYVEVAKAFFEGPEPAFVNATLDACARFVREHEV